MLAVLENLSLSFLLRQMGIVVCLIGFRPQHTPFPLATGHLCRAQLPEPASLWPKALPLGGPEPNPHRGQPPRKVKCGPGKGGRGLLPAGEGGGWRGTKEGGSRAGGGGVSGPWRGRGITCLCGPGSWGSCPTEWKGVSPLPLKET